MYTRKVDYTGRITLPSDLLDIFDIKKDDIVQVDKSDTHIIIKKHQPEFVCVVTGKITDKGKKIGKAFISEEGLKEISMEFQKEN